MVVAVVATAAAAASERELEVFTYTAWFHRASDSAQDAEVTGFIWCTRAAPGMQGGTGARH